MNLPSVSIAPRIASGVLDVYSVFMWSTKNVDQGVLYFYYVSLVLCSYVLPSNEASCETYTPLEYRLFKLVYRFVPH